MLAKVVTQPATRTAAGTTLTGSPSPCSAPPDAQAARQAPRLPGDSGRVVPGGFHLPCHGVSAEDIAAIVARQDLPGDDVNRPGPPGVP
jgi:hypothetical protein